MKKKKGISLIVLIVTIIVIIILAAAVILTINKNNTLSGAKEAVFRQDIATMKEELEIYKANMKYNDKNPETLNADKKSSPTVQEIITSMPNKYANILKIEEGKLVYVGKNKSEYIIAKEMGLIPEGTLIDDDILEELKPFITEWTVEDGDSITLPIWGKCNLKVDYGDGTGEYKVTRDSDENRIHTYEKAGTYTVTITGKCEQINFLGGNNTVSRNKITKLVQWGDLTCKFYSFYNCANLGGTIPEPSKNSFINVTDAYAIFSGCSSLTGSIPENLFKGASKITSFGVYWGAGTFAYCKNLTGSIPEKLFEDCVNATDFSSTFYGCSGLTGKIPSNLFKNCTKATKFSGSHLNNTGGGVFEKCTGITEIGDGLFSNNSLATDFTAVFKGCTGITNIPENLFRNCSSATDFAYAFSGCSSIIGNIPSKLFVDSPNVTTFTHLFDGCNLLNSIGEGLFENKDKVTDFSFVFLNCSSIKEIPGNIFSGCDAVTTYSNTFSNCTNLNYIPSGLFDSSINVTDFSGVFQQCSKIESVPKNLFRYNTKVTTFGNSGAWHGAFLGCKNLKEVPEDTFKYNTEVTDFSLAFWACSNLTKVPDLSNNTKVVKISMMFSDCVKLTGEVYPIWNNGLITSHSKTFNGCSKLSNYSEIPAGWK